MSYMRTPRLDGSGEASPDSRSALARTATSVAAAGLRSPPPGGQGDASGGAELVRTRTANQQLTRQFSFANFDREFARCAPPPLPWKSDYIVSLCPALDIGKQYNRMRQRTAAPPLVQHCRAPELLCASERWLPPHAQTSGRAGIAGWKSLPRSPQLS
eukprot:SAG31_NODE_12583_length_931_cov_1.078125_1_plen_157_part_01